MEYDRDLNIGALTSNHNTHILQALPQVETLVSFGDES